MKKKILMLLLAAISTGAMADWVKYAETETDAFYIDPFTIKKNGSFRKVWEIRNLTQRDQLGAMSARSLKEYDCKEERSRTLNFSLHTEAMAKGETIYNDTAPTNWHYLPPDTVAASTLKFVCSK